MMKSRLRTPLSYLGATAGAAASFVLTAGLMDQTADANVVGIPLLVAAAIAVTSGWRELKSAVRASPQNQVLTAAAGGVAAFWAAPLLALLQRATDAPSGAETLFFTTSCWGALATASALFAQGGWRRPRGLSAAILSLAGVAGLLASWERPSSFSPFAKFPAEELMMLVAGVVFVVGATMLMTATQRLGARATLTIALSGAALTGMTSALPATVAAFGSLPLLAPQLTLLGASVYLFSWGWVNLSSQTRVDRAASSLLVVPVALTALSIVERATGVYGADPIQWSGAVAGAAVCVAAAAVVFVGSSLDTTAHGDTEPWFWPWIMWASVVACVSGVVSLFLPAIKATSEGTFSEPFAAAWTMVGIESAAGWVAAAAGVLCLVAVFEARRPSRAWSAAWSSVSVVVAVCAYPFLLDTTLHTWNSWIPSDVLTSYGTEYARFTVDGIVEPVRTATIVAVGIIATVLLVHSVRMIRSAAKAHSEVDR